MSATKEKTTNAENVLEPESIKAGHLVSLTYWGRVTGNHQRGTDFVLDIDPVTEGGISFSVHGADLIRQAKSADGVASETVKCSQHEIAERFLESVRLPITVCFTKLTDGEQRILRGRVVSPNNVLGESLVEDLDLPASGPSRIRTVYHKQIDWLIADGVRYELKTKRKAAKKK